MLFCRIVEWKNRSLKEMDSLMLHEKALPPNLWDEILNCFNHILNRSPNKFVKENNPFEAWSGKKLEFAHFHIFGSRAWARIPSEKKKALDPQSHPCIFVGYPDGVKGYRLLDPSTDQLIIERSVQFEESPLHGPHEPHAEAFVLPPVVDDESTHSDHTIDSSSDTESEDSKDTNAQSEHSNVNSVHADEEPQQMPKWALSTFQDA
jgi:hypothetical protein